MTDNKTRVLHQKIIKLRKQLSDLEIGRSKSEPNTNPEIWQAFLNINLELDRLEQVLIRINDDLTQDINQLQDDIIAKLTEYNQCSQTMREMEKLFMVNFLRPGSILKQATQQRKYLEKEYSRIRSGIITYQYDTLSDVESDIQKVLDNSEKAFNADEYQFKDEKTEEKELWKLVENLDPKNSIEAVNEDQIIQDFKRIVLPSVHPDTSKTPKETFLTVMSAYMAKDFLLIQSYIVQYQGKFIIEEEQDPLIVNETLSQYQQEYYQLAERLNRRLKALKEELTPGEINEPQRIKENLIKHREQILYSIQLETEKIFELGYKIQQLTELFLQIKGEDDA